MRGGNENRGGRGSPVKSAKSNCSQKPAGFGQKGQDMRLSLAGWGFVTTNSEATQNLDLKRNFNTWSKFSQLVACLTVSGALIINFCPLRGFQPLAAQLSATPHVNFQALPSVKGYSSLPGPTHFKGKGAGVTQL